MSSSSREIFPAVPAEKMPEQGKMISRRGGQGNNGSSHPGSTNPRNANMKSSVTNESGRAFSGKQNFKRLPEDLSKPLTTLSKDSSGPITGKHDSSPLSTITSDASEAVDRSKTPSGAGNASTGISVGIDLQNSPCTPPSGPSSSSSSSFQLPGSASSVTSALTGRFQVRDNHFDPSPTSNAVPSVSAALPPAPISTSGKGKSNSVDSGDQLQSTNASGKSLRPLISSSTSEETTGQKLSPSLDSTASPEIACTAEKKEVQSREGFTSHTRPILSNLADAIGTGKVDQTATHQEFLKWDGDESRVFTAMKDALKQELGKEKDSFVDTCRLFLVAVLASTVTMGVIVTVFWVSVFSDVEDQAFGPLPT